ncbi:MAG: YdeI/OmpD-associated family protein [Pseudomonadota bacterium]
MDSYFTHEFQSEIAKFGVGKARKVWYRVVFMPPELESELPFDEFPRLRVDGEIAEIPIASAFMPTGDGRRYLIVSPTLLKDAGLQLGDPVNVRFRIADQDHVDVPEALVKVLDENAEASRLWEALTPGKQRALAFHVAGAKRAPTVEKRLAEVFHALTERNGSLR